MKIWHPLNGRRFWRDRVAELLAEHDAAERQHFNKVAAAIKARQQGEADWLMPGLYGTTRWADCGCSAWDAKGDRPVAVWCREHCPDCDDFCPCVIHDQALWAEMERKYAS